MKKLFLSLLLCTTLILSGCSAKQISNIPSDTPMEKSANDYNTANFNSDEVAYEDGGDDTQASDSDIKSESETDASGSDLSGSDKEDSQKNQKLVYTCDLNIESLEYDKTVSSIKDQIKKYKGIIQEENESDSNSYWYNSSKSTGTKHLYMVIRIPSDSYEAFLNDINGDGKIV